MKAELMQEYRHWQSCPSRGHCHRLGEKAVQCWWGQGGLGPCSFPLLRLCLLEWIPLSYFAFPPPFPAQFPQLPALQAFSSPTFLLFSSICIFSLRAFFHSCFSSLAFSAMHFHPGVSFLPALSSVSAHLLCSMLSKLVLTSCSNCPKAPAKRR